MMKLMIAVCVVAYVAAVNHHPGTGDNGNHNNHHPGGNIDCQQTSDCPSCNNDTLTVVCENFKCVCITQRAKRAPVCHDQDCTKCPDGQRGFCNDQGHCECGDHIVGKRAGETCSTASDCPDCAHGTPTCEKHNDQEGHCHCKN